MEEGTKVLNFIAGHVRIKVITHLREITDWNEAESKKEIS